MPHSEHRDVALVGGEVGQITALLFIACIGQRTLREAVLHGYRDLAQVTITTTAKVEGRGRVVRKNGHLAQRYGCADRVGIGILDQRTERKAIGATIDEAEVTNLVVARMQFGHAEVR